MINRDYNNELNDNMERKYIYNFDQDVMHRFMIEAFKPFFISGNSLELGSYKGIFTKRLTPFFEDITCVEASSIAIEEAKNNLSSFTNIKYITSKFEKLEVDRKYDNIILTHVLEHIDNPVELLKKIREQWLSENGRLFIVCPNANAASRQIAVKMGIIDNTRAVTKAEFEHGHRITYTFDTLERDVSLSGLNVVHKTGIFFKALANFQWDQLMQTDIITDEYLVGCYKLGLEHPNLCSSIFFVCEIE
ncbi:class I SAM-dependent methyltransferase [Psychrobacillus sp. NPDC096389]|uniref:class I SAM-dependent methyltransferase n=1 Tax=Psychrobacillus sp. NPDC096389 TaxID=3364490 RepID=UPI003828011E